MPELLDQTNHVAWFNAGATIFSPKGIQYLGVPGLINAKNIVATLIVQVRHTFPCRAEGLARHRKGQLAGGQHRLGWSPAGQ